MKIGNFDVTLDNVGSWPKHIKYVTYLILILIIGGLVYWFDTQNQMAELHKASKQEFQLKTELNNKYQAAANLLAYKQQLKSMQEMFEGLKLQLPNNTEVHNLVDEISEAAQAAGLKLGSIKPGQEKRQSFYAIFPITLNVRGNYHQFGDFISKLAGLNRIIIPGDFVIKPMGKAQIRFNEATEQLTMNISIFSYRYAGKG